MGAVVEVADEVGAGESAELADGVDEADGSGGCGFGEDGSWHGPERWIESVVDCAASEQERDGQKGRGGGWRRPYIGMERLHRDEDCVEDAGDEERKSGVPAALGRFVGVPAVDEDGGEAEEAGN